jgi:hypothetical protein
MHVVVSFSKNKLHKKKNQKEKKERNPEKNLNPLL